MNFTVADTAVADLVRLLASMPDPASMAHASALELELATRFATRHAVAVSSGTAALHLALSAIGIGTSRSAGFDGGPGAGDEVLVPALSVVMSAAPVVHAGARPVFVDCNADGSDLDFDDLAAKTTRATKAVLPVHLWGRAGDPARLVRFAADHDLRIVEDACQAQGTDVGDRPAGTHGAVGCFSMKDGKVLWCGEGGYLLTDDDEIAAYARSLRSHNQPPGPAGFPPQVGYNFRLAEPLAVIARANLARFDASLGQRRHQAELLGRLLDGTPGLVAIDPPDGQRWNRYSFLATITLPGPRAFSEHLAAADVPNSVGTFRLVPADQRPEFATHAGPPCRNAAAVVDRTLAVLLTDHDDDQRITGYAQTIIREAHRWQQRT